MSGYYRYALLDPDTYAGIYAQCLRCTSHMPPGSQRYRKQLTKRIDRNVGKLRTCHPKKIRHVLFRIGSALHAYAKEVDVHEVRLDGVEDTCTRSYSPNHCHEHAHSDAQYIADCTNIVKELEEIDDVTKLVKKFDDLAKNISPQFRKDLRESSFGSLPFEAICRVFAERYATIISDQSEW